MSQETINKVYMEALKLKKSSLSVLEIREKLENMGFPVEICAKAAEDIQIEREKDIRKKGKERIRIGLGILILGIIVMFGTFFVSGRFMLLPLGFLGIGFVLIISGFISSK